MTLALALLLLAAPQSSDAESWAMHAGGSAATTVAVDLVIDHPAHAALVAIALNLGHEYGQYRVRGRWTTDSTMDVISGTLGAVLAGWVRHRWRERRRDQQR
jgi:hypothetical protein